MRKTTQRLVGVFFVFLILFNFPILNIFWKQERVLGVPMIFLYIFAVWLLLLIAVYYLTERPAK